MEVDYLTGNWAFGGNAYLLSFEDDVFGADATLFGGQVSYLFNGAGNDGWMLTGKGQIGTIDVTTTVLTGVFIISFGNRLYGCDDHQRRGGLSMDMVKF